MNEVTPVSIIIPVYNGSNFLGEAIDSALAQTYPNIEVIVVNDGSDDNGATRSVSLSFGKQIKYFEKPNGGVASALNIGISKMQGEYFSWLSHDDIYYPTKIEEQVKAVLAEQDNTIIYSDFDLIDSNGKRLYVSRLPEIDSKYFRFWLTKQSRLNGCTLLIPYNAFRECGYFNENLLTIQDYDLWFRFAESYKFVHLPEILISSRQHDSQVTKKMPDIVKYECNTMHFKFFSQLRKIDLPYSEIKSYFKLVQSFLFRRFYKATDLALDHILKMNPKLSDMMQLYLYKIISKIAQKIDK